MKQIEERRAVWYDFGKGFKGSRAPAVRHRMTLVCSHLCRAVTNLGTDAERH